MPGSRMRYVLMGDGSLLTECGDVLLRRGHEICAVVTTAPDVSEWSAQNRIAVWDSESVVQNGLKGIDCDWFFNIANFRILPKHVWQVASKGAANFHDGPLPQYAGLNAPAWALMAAETEYGVTWHELSERVDEGGIFIQKMFQISDDETSLTLNMKCFEAGLASFETFIDQIEMNVVKATPQTLSKRSYYGRYQRPRGAATVDFTKSSADIVRLARALNFGDRYPNPLSLPKLKTADRVYNIQSVKAIPTTATQAPGTVLSVDRDYATIRTSDSAVRIGHLTDDIGAQVNVEAILRSGMRLAQLNAGQVEEIDVAIQSLVRHEQFFRDRLKKFRALELPHLAASTGGAPLWHTMSFELPASVRGTQAVAGVAAALGRICGTDHIDLFFADDTAREPRSPYISRFLPLSVESADDKTCQTFLDEITNEICEMEGRQGFASDLVTRDPAINDLHSTVTLILSDTAVSDRFNQSPITFCVPIAASTGRMTYDQRRLTDENAEKMLRQIEILLRAFNSPNTLVGRLPLMSDETLHELLHARNATKRNYDRSALIHTLIEKQAAATPDAIALAFGDQTMTYAELNDKANRLAAHLMSLGVGPDTMVGLNLERSSNLVVGALGIWKAGAAYVPLDPGYPSDRIDYMIEDSGLNILLMEGSHAAKTELPGVTTLSIETTLSSASHAGNIPSRSTSHNLAYVIYTSGSTGRPKGVMIEHRNVINFFAGMDERIAVDSDQQPVWLAVTSLSFDISVLELFWTLTRGFKVVILPDGRRDASRAVAKAPRPIDFGLFYWGDDNAPGDKYRLLLDGARFADTHGFSAVWTPERHFHAFGGAYPNPSVTGAAVAAITSNVSIRAGSCVLPLHHPARVVEEWSVVDNISNGRAAVAFASGWMPEDFILRPENTPPANRQAMLCGIETVQKLWSGESVSFSDAAGQQVSIVTQPRPVQKRLPIWITTAGNPETFRDAARAGANVLTHLLGQSLEEVAEKIAAYRDELRRQSRDPSQFKVTLMLHTLVGNDRNAVRELAREPMKRYLKSANALIKQYAWAFPAFKRPAGVTRPLDIDLRSLSEEESDAVVEFAFDRYFNESAMFGTVDEVVARVEQVSAIGVDEIACLIDYGIPADQVMQSLSALSEAVRTIKARSPAAPTVQADDAPSESIGSAISRHHVTHMQCTPAMAAMILESPDDARALNHLRHFYIGGEALQGALVKRLQRVTSAGMENMYGPTETTIWSSTGPAANAGGSSPLGTPIANTQLYVLDSQMRPVPRGVPGVLYIGGDGVARGYHNRPDLTAERFLANPFVSGGRVYRTGDIVRIGKDDTIHFIGREDNQVKVRGHRIELGEIENCIAAHPGIAQAIVVVREDDLGDVRIVAYVRFQLGRVADDDLRTHIRQSLPDYMMPAHFVTVDQFPLTPNLKVDRQRLPKPSASNDVSSEAEYSAPVSEVEKQIAEVFKRVLGATRIGMNDNFFSLGGHSLLAVQAHRELKAKLMQKLVITDLYRFPTVAGLVGHIQSGGSAGNKHLSGVAARAAERRAAFAARRAATLGRADT